MYTVLVNGKMTPDKARGRTSTFLVYATTGHFWHASDIRHSWPAFYELRTFPPVFSGAENRLVKASSSDGRKCQPRIEDICSTCMYVHGIFLKKCWTWAVLPADNYLEHDCFFLFTFFNGVVVSLKFVKRKFCHMVLCQAHSSSETKLWGWLMTSGAKLWPSSLAACIPILQREGCITLDGGSYLCYYESYQS